MSALLEKLNDQQKEAVLHQEGPAIVLAGAGSGKTTVLTTRTAHLIQQKQVDPRSLLVVTFTNKAAGEIRQRIKKLTGYNLPFSGTFHSLCARILRQEGQHIGLDPDFVIYDTNDQKQLLKQIYKERGIKKGKFGLRAVKNSISDAKNELLSPADYAQVSRGNFQEQVAQIYRWYQKELEQAQAVDFDDLLLKALRLLQNVPPVRDKYQQQLEHILVDEYQDTNKAQYELTKLLTKPHNNLYVVGDFSQSIYAWRGADYRNMLQLQQDFANVTEYRLEQNYRSNQTILDAATQIISQNTQHPILELWTDKSSGNSITVLEAESSRTEARRVVDFIKKEQQKHPYHEMAILYRTNAQSREFEEALIRASIPYRLVGGTKFYERKEIMDLIAYLRYYINRNDTVSFERIKKLGKRRLKSYQQWLAKQDEQNQDEGQSDDQEAPENQQSPAEILKTILDVTNYLDKYQRKTEENLSRKENVQEMINVAAQFNSIRQLLENIALLQDDTFIDKAAEQNHQQNAVNLMSLHSAKGLEFAVVFMVGMEDGLLPHSRSMMEAEQMEEERRLCYVGITRAKSKLYLTHAQTRYQYGSKQNSLPSRFLQDISQDLVTTVGQRRSTNKTQKKRKKAKRAAEKRRRYVPVDSGLAEGVLKGEFDIDAFIDS